MRLLISLFLAVGFSSCGQAQVVRNVQAYGITHSSIRWTYESDNRCHQIYYGTSSNEYPYSSDAVCTGDDRVSLSIGGLAPSTTYYFRMATWPDSSSQASTCATDACGSPEFTATTLPAPEIHPQLPEPPREWIPEHPDTSGYYVVPMMQDATGECVAANSVSGASVQALDKIEQILNRVPYGTVIEFPQGIECIVPEARNSGYVLPVKPLDPAAGGDITSPNHKWIIFRTAQLSPADFPPFGARTGSSWAPKMAKFIAQAPTYISRDSPGKGRGQIFSAEDGGGQHHFWFENLELTTTKDPEKAPSPTDLDPAPYSAFVGLFPTYPSRLPPDISHIVMDRLYIHGQGHPNRYNRGVTLGGAYQAMIGCALQDLDYWRTAEAPNQAPDLQSGQKVLSIPPVSYTNNRQEGPVGITTPATVTLTASNSYSGDYALILGPEQGTLRVLYTAPGPGTTISLTCEGDGCSVIRQQQLTIPSDSYRYCQGSIQNGQFQSPRCWLDWHATRYGYGWGTAGVELMDGGTGPYYLSNNLLAAVGMGLYIDAGGGAYDFEHKISYSDNSNDDTLFLKNHMIFGQDHQYTSPLSNGFRYPVRNLFETKRSRRWKIEGNLFQNYWSHQNDGAALLFAGASPTYSITNKITGILDQTITSNIIRHGATGIAMGAAVPYYISGEQPGNYLIENNLIYGLASRYLYSDGAPSLYTGSVEGGARDVTVRHNTIGPVLGDLPALFFADTSGIIMEGFAYEDNVAYLNFGGYSGGVFIKEDPNMNLRRLPAIDTSSPATMLRSAFIRTETQGVVPNYSFARNLIIGGVVYPGSGENPQSMTDAKLRSIAQYFPGNYFPMTGTDSMADREAAAGLVNPQNQNYRLSPNTPYASGGSFAAPNGTSLGADFDRLESDTGLVTHIAAPQVTTNSVTFQYTAPDQNTCAVDISANDSDWRRITDGGGDRQRLVTFPDLPSGTLHSYRIVCYYRQVNDGILYTDFLNDQITDGVFSTTAIRSRIRSPR